MKLSTSSNIVFERPDKSIMPMVKMLDLASGAGFDVFDISFYDWSLPGSPFLTDRWREWIEQIAEHKDKLGVSFGQCHAYTYNFLDSRMSEDEKTYHEMLVLRSIECCAIVGSRLCVTHPETRFGVVNQTKLSRQGNLEYFGRLFDKIAKFNMELAVENMCDVSISPRRKYGVTPEELVDLVETFSDSRLGICWDFEHADIMEQNQRDCLLYIRKHLKATHVSDTHSATVPELMHVLPLFGKVDWREVMRTLREIDYQGFFSFEVNNYGNYFPDPLLPSALALAYEIGRYLLGMGVEDS
jgi:L-ribulose-5-phosphate 3-epimerase